MKEIDFITFLDLYGQTILDVLEIYMRKSWKVLKSSKQRFLKMPAIPMTLRKYRHILQQIKLKTDGEKTNDEDGNENDGYIKFDDEPENDETEWEFSS